MKRNAEIEIFSVDIKPKLPKHLAAIPGLKNLAVIPVLIRLAEEKQFQEAFYYHEYGFFEGFDHDNNSIIKLSEDVEEWCYLISVEDIYEIKTGEKS